MKRVRFGIIGCGLMGREFASAAARWAHLADMDSAPEIVAVCDANAELLSWYTENFPTIRQATPDYRALLANPAVEAVYCAVPHHLHREIYCAAIAAGKHLMGEKPFGIDRPANDAILACCAEHPKVFVRCSSEFPFFPAVQRIGGMIEAGAFGRIIEVNAGLPARQRPRSAETDQLETPGPVQRPVRLHGRPGHARLPRAAAGRLDSAERARGALEHRPAAPRRPRRDRPVRYLGQRHAAVRCGGPRHAASCFP